MIQHPFVETLWKAVKGYSGLPKVVAAVFLLNRLDVKLNWMEKSELEQAIKEGGLHFRARMYGLRK